MAFATNKNFRQAWAVETTIAFLRRITIGRRLNAAYDGDAQTAEIVYAQNPNYNIIVTEHARKADWAEPVEPSASRIAIAMNKRARVENMLYVEDEVENAVRNYRSRLQTASLSALAKKHESNVVAYMLALASTGGATVNGNAGPIVEIEFAGDTDIGFDPDTGKPNGTDAQKATAREWIEEFLTDARVKFERKDIPLADAPLTIGGGVSQAWCALPVELYAYGLAKLLEKQGISLDYVANILRNLGVFGSSLAGHYRGFDLFVTNSLSKPADKDGVWSAFAGTDEALAGPLRPVRNYMTEPANAKGERYEFRHVMTHGQALINSDLLLRGTFNAADGT